MDNTRTTLRKLRQLSKGYLVVLMIGFCNILCQSKISTMDSMEKIEIIQESKKEDSTLFYLIKNINMKSNQEIDFEIIDSLCIFDFKSFYFKELINLNDSIAIFCTREGVAIHIYGVNKLTNQIIWDQPYIKFDWFLDIRNNFLIKIVGTQVEKYPIPEILEGKNYFTVINLLNGQLIINSKIDDTFDVFKDYENTLYTLKLVK